MVKTKKYQNGKIYQIVDNAFQMCYIGSTIDTLNNRFCSHKSRYYRYKLGLVNFTSVYKIFDECGIDNCKIIHMEHYPCQTREELSAREGYYIKNNDCVNKNIAGRTRQEYKQDNLTRIKTKYEDWKEQNVEHIKNYKKEYHKSHKEERKTYQKNKYQQNKNQLLEKKMCKCGKIYTAQHIRRHEKSQKHQNYIKQTSKEIEEEAPPASLEV